MEGLKGRRRETTAARVVTLFSEVSFIHVNFKRPERRHNNNQCPVTVIGVFLFEAKSEQENELRCLKSTGASSFPSSLRRLIVPIQPLLSLYL